MRISFIAVGSELLGTERLDTNSLTMAKALREFGLSLERKSVVGDGRDLLSREIKRYAATSDLLVICGGLGPTSDDRTRESVAQALGRSLVRNEMLVEKLHQRFAQLGRTMARANLAQADLIEGAETLTNPWGSAPGQWLCWKQVKIILLPGPPREFGPMIEQHLRPWLLESQGQPGIRVLLKVACVPESLVEDRLQPFYEEFGEEGLTILASPGEIRLELEDYSHGGAVARLEAKSKKLKELMGQAVFTEEEESLEAVVGRLLKESGKTVATAESCTGGFLGYRFTSVPGASDWYLGGIVAYQNQVKMDSLGVDGSIIERDGAVSETVARAMAEGARERLGADYGLAVTGVAGPGGGTAEKPVGTVHLSLADGEGRAWHRQVGLPGDRDLVRRLSSQVALEMVRRVTLNLPWRGFSR